MKKHIKVVICFIFITFMSAEVFEGYTFFTRNNTGGGGGGGITYLMDHNSNFIKSWSHSLGAASLPYLLPDSSFIYPYRVQNPSMNAGGVGGGIQRITWDNDILWNYTFANATYQHHHDVEPLPSGNILLLCGKPKPHKRLMTWGDRSLIIHLI